MPAIVVEPCNAYAYMVRDGVYTFVCQVERNNSDT